MLQDAYPARLVPSFYRRSLVWTKFDTLCLSSIGFLEAVRFSNDINLNLKFVKRLPGKLGQSLYSQFRQCTYIPLWSSTVPESIKVIFVVLYSTAISRSSPRLEDVERLAILRPGVCVSLQDP